MNDLNILFLNCTLKPSPEVSNTEALWHLVAKEYQQQGSRTQQMRLVDCAIAPSHQVIEAVVEDGCSQILAAIYSADILLLGLPVSQGVRSSDCNRLLARLQTAQRSGTWPNTTASAKTYSALVNPLYNKVFGLLLLSDATSGNSCIAQTCYDFSRLGYSLPPDNVVIWTQPIDTCADFIEAAGQYSKTVKAAARRLVQNSVALAQALRVQPLPQSLLSPNSAIASGSASTTTTPLKSAPFTTHDAATQLTPKAIRTPFSTADKTTDLSISQSAADSIDYRQLTKRIWTVMQAGMARGFEFQVLSLPDRTYRAERNGRGFIYKIYPGHFSFRTQYQDYSYEQTKAHKLALMESDGLAVPTSYGLFKSFAEIVARIPPAQLPFPLVVKPDSGSLSENVFPNLHTQSQLQQAANTIEASGSTIQLESHVSGRNFRVLIINRQFAGCVERRPASVTGDGQHSILELFHLRNQEPGRGDHYEAHTTLHKLVFDHTSRKLLNAAGYCLDTILPKGEVCFIQEKITAATGSDYIDCTEQIHHSIVRSCIDFSRQFSTLTLGFDLITTDISQPLSVTDGAFNEYNFLPYVDLHENCNIGKQRPVCRLIWDYIEANQDRLVTPEFEVF